MKKRVFILAALLLVVVAVIAAANSPYVIDRLLGYSSHATGRKIAAHDIDIDWGWPITRVSGRDISLGNVSWGTDPTMAAADYAEISINLLALLKGRLAFPDMRLTKPKLVLEKNDKGNANWDFTSNPGGSVAVAVVSPDDRTDFPVIGSLIVSNGELIYRDPAAKTDINLAVDTIQGQAKPRHAVRFAGKGTYQNKEFSLNLTGGNVFMLRDTKDPYPLRVDLKAGGTSAHLQGTVLDPFTLKGIDIALSLKGQDAAELFTLIGMALPPTPPYDVTGHLTYADKRWEFTDFKGRMGDSDLSGSISWDTNRKRPLLQGAFVSNNLDFDDLGGFIGATPSVKAGETASAEQKQEAAKEQESPYVIPDTPLDISRLAAMDAQVTFTGNKLISENLPLDDFYMKVYLNDRVLKLLPVRFGTAKGDISAILTIDAHQEPVQIGGDFTFTKLSLKPIFESLAKKLGTKNVTDGYIGGTAQLKGTGKSLRQMLATADGNIGLGMEGGRISNLVIELLGLDVAQSLGFLLDGDKPVPIRCIIGDFVVKDGLMDVRRFVLDTTDSNIVGKGDINLKNEEMDMTLYTRPKDTSILSLNSPIRMQGTLKDPKVNINPGKIIGKGTVAAAAGTLIFPVVGLLPFIEPGLGKDSNCGKLIRDMEAHTNAREKPHIIPKNKMPPAQPEQAAPKLSADR